MKEIKSRTIYLGFVIIIISGFLITLSSFVVSYQQTIMEDQKQIMDENRHWVKKSHFGKLQEV